MSPPIGFLRIPPHPDLVPAPPVRRCYLFKPDGIGDFFLATGFIRLMAREFGEESLLIAVLPVMEPVVRAQFPQAEVVVLPLRRRRVVLNLFAANCLRCFLPWLRLLTTRAEVSVSLRHMRDYLQNVLFHSVPSRRRYVASNGLLGNGKAVRRLTERAFVTIFGDRVVDYPVQGTGLPLELEAHRKLAEAVLGRDVTRDEVTPVLKAVSSPVATGSYAVCAPYSSGNDKDVPDARWITLFLSLATVWRLSRIVLTGSVDQAERLESFRNALMTGLDPLGTDVEIRIEPTLQGFIDLLAGAEAVFTVDTAAAHAATALDRPALILFSGLHLGMFAPWRRSSRQCWLLPARPDSGPAWHESLPDESILEAARGILSRESGETFETF